MRLGLLHSQHCTGRPQPQSLSNVLYLSNATKNPWIHPNHQAQGVTYTLTTGSDIPSKPHLQSLETHKYAEHFKTSRTSTTSRILHSLSVMHRTLQFLERKHLSNATNKSTPQHLSNVTVPLERQPRVLEVEGSHLQSYNTTPLSPISY